ncbi:PREDICTED: aspartic proteinase-like protein 2 [Nelumbo nucifera]|uniref:Aspartic proteinase-like protein 2 n=1 Tax=Nelumbo nucifera TaxID=4432 RepID=A0A1U8BBI4_NELNU|nr:PREDICTED: aspartic proteinase-like protein 2 [Nelumbo nucifera]
MERARLRVVSALLMLSSIGIIYLSFSSFCSSLEVRGDPDNYRRSFHGSGRRRGPSIILPLFLSFPNSSRTFVEGKFRRQLQTAEHQPSNAHMRLYDDLLSNGYYTTRLWIGTPPQEFALIVDSGSSVTYVPCSTCEQCGKHQDPRFQPDLSSTYEPVKCNVGCYCDDDRVYCTYERQYAEMSSSSGVLGEDIISFGNESELMPQRAVFGCENIETGDLYSQHADGIMGLGHGQLSIVDQLVEKGIISDSFSLCYGGMDVGGGAMVLGGFPPPPDMVFSNSDPGRSPYYNIELKEIHVAGKPLQLNPKIFDGKYGTVLDSGTTYAYLPNKAFKAFKDAIIKKLRLLKQIRGPDPNYNDICFSGAGSDVSLLSKTFPAVDMVFSNGEKLSLAPENYLFRHSKVRGAYCLGIFQNGKDPTTLLGGIIVRNTLVTYDRENEKIGFWKTNCSELWKRLHISNASSPAPSISYSKNSTTVTSPSLAPNGMPSNIIPGESRVGLIMFDMSLSVKYSDMAPHITELAEFIAHELDVNTSQVHLLNFSSKGNDSIIRWAIFPAESADYIPNPVAMSIIVQLTEHHMHLPDAFGNYQLVDWKVEPPRKRKWWKQHLAMVIGAIITLVICLSALGIWFIWRHKHRVFGMYKPIHSTVPEHELQQL